MSGAAQAAGVAAPPVRRPLLSAACWFALGAALGLLGGAPAGPLLMLGGVLLGLVVWRPAQRMSVAALAFAALSLGVAAATVELSEYESSALRHLRSLGIDGELPVLLSGSLAEDPDEIGQRWIVVLDVTEVEFGGQRHRTKGRARIQIDGQAERPMLIEGDGVRLWARVDRPRGARNPGGFDRGAHARRRAVHLMGYCKSPLLMQVEGRNDAGWLRGGVAHLRQRVREALKAGLDPGPDGGIVRAMVLGDRGGLDEETEEAFRVAGTYHVLALSGAQVALVVGMILWFVRRVAQSPAAESLFAIVGVVGYALFVGSDIPVTRAAVMAVVLLLGRAAGFRGEAANLLGLAALGLLTYRASWVSDVGFQLSFVATLALVLLTPVFMPVVGAVRFMPRIVAMTLAASAAAQIGVTPLLAWHFNRLAPAALVLNLAAIPLSSIVLVAGFGLALFAWAPPLAGVAAFVAEGAAGLMRRSSALALAVPGADIRVPTPSWPLILVFAALLVALVRRPERRVRVACLLGGALVALTVGTGGPAGDGRLYLTLLDVGEGDSLVLRSPSGRFFLVDTGGRLRSGRSLGEMVAGPYLWSQGVTRLDGLALTHPHDDHVAGAPFILRSFRVGELWEGPVRRSELAGEIAAAARGSDTARLTVFRGFRRLWDGVEIEALWPPPASPPSGASTNDRSLVLRLRYGTVELLLTGDITAASEATLAAGSADVLKVPHHGSRSSSSPAFVEEVRPGVALVSCGRRRTRGGGGREVFARYAEAGARVLRTDREGAVTAATDGRRLWVGAVGWPLQPTAQGARARADARLHKGGELPATRW